MDFFKDKYYAPENKFKGINRLWDDIKDEAQKLKLTRKNLSEFLKSQEYYQRKMVRNKKPDYPSITASPHSYQADLTFFTDVSKRNKGYTCILNIIEITSRKAYAYPLKTKSGEEVLDAFKQFKSDAKEVKSIEVDAGTEFVNKLFTQWCEHNKIKMIIYNNNKRSMGMIERFHRTLRDILSSLDENKNWIEYLEQAVDIYNNSKHSSTGYKPNEVTDKIAEGIRSLRNEHNDKVTKKMHQQFQVGDQVRYFINKTQFQKGSGKFSAEAHRIERIEGFSLYLNGIDRPFRYYQLLLVQDNEKAPGGQQVDAELAKEQNAYKVARKLGDLRESGEKVVQQQEKVESILNDKKNELPIALRRGKRNKTLGNNN